MKINAKIVFVLDVSCPGVSSPCSGNGKYDLTVGECTCYEGFQGTDCFGEVNLKYILRKFSISIYVFHRIDMSS